jgi:hypothetical protein
MRQKSLTQPAADFAFVDPRYGTLGPDERAVRRSCRRPTLAP